MTSELCEEIVKKRYNLKIWWTSLERFSSDFTKPSEILLLRTKDTNYLDDLNTIEEYATSLSKKLERYTEKFIKQVWRGKEKLLVGSHHTLQAKHNSLFGS